MTIGGWIGYIIITLCVISGGIAIAACSENLIAGIVVAIVLCGGLFFGMRWYYQNTASGQRALTDQQSDLSNGLERTITIYTADGKIIAQYSGKIDIEGNDGGYVLFDYNGNRYTYYNCFVESVAKIK